MKKYKGYTASIDFDADEMVLHGRLDNIRDVITFHATSVEELQREFEAAVDDYLAFCAERNEEPEKPFSGRFVLRLDPQMHRKAALAADRSGVSLNTWVGIAVAEALDRQNGAWPYEEEFGHTERVARVVYQLLAREGRDQDQTGWHSRVGPRAAVDVNRRFTYGQQDLVHMAKRAFGDTRIETKN